MCSFSYRHPYFSPNFYDFWFPKDYIYAVALVCSLVFLFKNTFTIESFFLFLQFNNWNFFCTYNEEQVDISKENYENVIAIFWKKNAEGNEEIACLGASISEKWILVTIKDLNTLNQYSVTTATIGKSSLKLTIAGKQRIGGRSNFIIVVVSISTFHWGF